jgi:hypothetical protein
MPTFEPGCGDTTIPERLVVPSAPLGGARTEPASPGPPKPMPFLPEPEESEVVPTDGGGGTTLLASVLPLPELAEFRVLLEDELLPATDGGGGITFDPPRDELCDRAGEPASPTDGGGGTTFALRAVRRDPGDEADELLLAADGGGGITFAARVDPDEELRVVPAEFPVATVGGGGTTSCVPKSLPMMLLTSDPFAD